MTRALTLGSVVGCVLLWRRQLQHERATAERHLALRCEVSDAFDTHVASVNDACEEFGRRVGETLKGFARSAFA